MNQIVKKIPFDFPESESYLNKDEHIHSNILFSITPPLPISNQKKKILSTIIELTNTTLNIHSDILNPYKHLNKNNHFEEKNKQRILAGDYYFSHALSLIPEIENQKVEIFIYQQIQKACLGRLHVESKTNPQMPKNIREYKKIILSKIDPLFLCCFTIPFMLGNHSKKTLSILKEISKKFSLLYQFTQDYKELSKKNGTSSKKNSLWSHLWEKEIKKKLVDLSKKTNGNLEKETIHFIKKTLCEKMETLKKKYFYQKKNYFQMDQLFYSLPKIEYFSNL